MRQKRGSTGLMILAAGIMLTATFLSSCAIPGLTGPSLRWNYSWGESGSESSWVEAGEQLILRFSDPRGRTAVSIDWEVLGPGSLEYLPLLGDDAALALPREEIRLFFHLPGLYRIRAGYSFAATGASAGGSEGFLETDITVQPGQAPPESSDWYEQRARDDYFLLEPFLGDYRVSADSGAFLFEFSLALRQRGEGRSRNTASFSIQPGMHLMGTGMLTVPGKSLPLDVKADNYYPANYLDPATDEILVHGENPGSGEPGVLARLRLSGDTIELIALGRWDSPPNSLVSEPHDFILNPLDGITKLGPPDFHPRIMQIPAWGEIQVESEY